MSPRTRIVASLAFLVVAHLAVLFAGFLAPLDPTRQHRSYPWVPPMELRWIDADGRWHARPFVFPPVDDPSSPGDWIEDATNPVKVVLFARGSEHRILGVLSTDRHLIGLEDGSPIFLMGTDEYGRDQFSRFLFGGRISLAAGLVATALSLLGGALAGTIAGFYGRWADEGLMRFAELFLALPWLYVLFAIRSLLPLSLAPGEAFLLTAAIIGVIGWARVARLTRGIVLSARERRFVTAARGFGASDVYLMRKHVLPQALGALLTQASLLIPHFIAAEMTLSFLGLGVGEPAPSWGAMLSSLREYHVVASHTWMFLPAVAILPIFFAYLVLASALQDARDAGPWSLEPQERLAT